MTIADPSETKIEKARLRQAAAAMRDALPAAHREAAALAIRDRVLSAGPIAPVATVGFYWPMRSEADPRPLAEGLAARGHELCLPVVVARQAPLIFRLWRPGDALVPGGFGTQVPAPAAAEIRPALLLVPLLAFDRRGFRLGYGGGFYDRTLGQLRATGTVRAIGLAFADQEIAQVPAGPADERLDAIATESDFVRVGAKKV